MGDDTTDLPTDTGTPVEETASTGGFPTDTGTSPTDTATDSGTDSKPVESDTAETDPTDTTESGVEPTDTDPTGQLPTGSTGETGDTGDTGDTGATGETAAPTCVFNATYSPRYPVNPSYEASFGIYDADGQEVFSTTYDEATSWSDSMVLPSGRYYAVYNKDGGRSYVQVVLREASNYPNFKYLSPDKAGLDAEWFEISCADDTGFVEDTGWSDEDPFPFLPPLWEDDGTHGTCAFALQVLGNFDSTTPSRQASFVFQDTDRNVLASRGPGAWTYGAQQTEILNLRSGRYLVQMFDGGGDGWNGGALRLLDGNGDTVHDITMEDGSEDIAYLDVVCEDDTAAYELWDTDPDLTDIDTGWYLGDAAIGCPVAFSMYTATVGAEMSFDVLDDQGDVVWASTSQWLLGPSSSEEEQHAFTALPNGDYTLRLRDAGSLPNGWGTWPYVRVYDGEGDFIGGGGHHGPGEYNLHAFSVDCAQDTDAWYASDIEALTEDTAWGGDDAWFDTDLAEQCGYMVEVAAGFTATNGGWSIHDDEGHVLYEVAPGDMTWQNGLYRTPVQLPSGVYRFKMVDISGGGFTSAGVPENFRLLDRDGEQVEAFGMPSGTARHSEWFVLDCADDTDTPALDSGWCEPVMDTSTSVEGACLAALHIHASYGFDKMGVALFDSDDRLVREIAPGDLDQRGDRYLPVELPTGGYRLELTHADGNAWNGESFVQVIPTDGACITGDEVITDKLTLNDANGLGGERTVYFEHSCDEDTGGDFAWDSGWCPAVLDTAEQPSGACGYVVKVQAQSSDHAYMAIDITDSSGASVLSIAAGDLPGKGIHYYPVNLPSDVYTIRRQATSWKTSWEAGSWVQILPADGACVDEAAATERYGLESGIGGDTTNMVLLNCDEDTSGDFLSDSGWCEPVLDTADAVNGTCGMMAVLYAGYDAANYGITVTDTEGTVVLDLQPGDVTSGGYHQYPLQMPSEGYEVRMWSNHAYNAGWATGSWLQFVPADGLCLDEDNASEKFTVTKYKEHTEYLTMDCADDGGGFEWSEDWCPEVLEPAEIPTGTCGFVLEVATGVDGAEMEIELTDSLGNAVFSVTAGDGQLSRYGRFHFPVDLPTDTYSLTLKDSSSWSKDWHADAYVRLVPNDGACLDEDAATESFRVDENALFETDLEVSCGGGDTATETGDTAP